MPTVPQLDRVERLAKRYVSKLNTFYSNNGHWPNQEQKKKMLADVLESEAIRHPERKRAYRPAIRLRANYLLIGTPSAS